VRPRGRPGSWNLVAALAASAVFLCWPAGAAQVPSVARGHAGSSGTGAHELRANIRAAAAPCDPTASLQPPPGPPTVTPGSFMAAIQARGYLIAGVDQNTYHFGYLNPFDDQIEGFDIDMLHAVAAAIFGDPNRIRFVAMSDAQRIPAVQSGEVDIVAHTMTITCARWKLVDFSTVYFDAGQRILVDKGSPIKGPQDLAGRKVCATKGSTSLTSLIPYHARTVAVTYWTDCLVLLQQGQVDAISTDDSILAGLEAQDPYTTIVGPSFSDEPYGLAISKQHPDFVRFVNAVLAQMRADGQWAASYERWVGSPAPAPPPAQYQA
jgi:polar amino acid transport system substrate-binding protein